MAARRRTEYRCPRGLEVQTVIFPREDWNASKARQWLREHDFTQAKIDTTGGSYRFRQRPPSVFVRGSFRTITLGDSVKAVVGCPLPGRESDKRAGSRQPAVGSKRKKSRRDAPYDLSPSGREPGYVLYLHYAPGEYAPAPSYSATTSQLRRMKKRERERVAVWLHGAVHEAVDTARELRRQGLDTRMFVRSLDGETLWDTRNPSDAAVLTYVGTEEFRRRASRRLRRRPREAKRDERTRRRS